MAGKVDRRTVDLGGYPDLVVIYLGMRVNRLAGVKSLFGFGPKIAQSVADRPDGLLLHENLIFSMIPPHAGMRQYWRDFDALERWARSEPHRAWWKRHGGRLRRHGRGHRVSEVCADTGGAGRDVLGA